MWKWAAGAFKDTNSLLKATLAGRSAHRNPDIEAAVVKATSHDDSYIDYYNTQRIYAWIRVSDAYLRPVLRSLSTRMERTRSWMVALKGLMLLHGVFCCKIPAIQKIGRLPFNLSSFQDREPQMGNYNDFIRDYYTYLDHKSSFIFIHSREKKNKENQKDSALMQDLVWLEKLQRLLDMLLEIRPDADLMMNVLVLEAMDCIVVEILDVYSRICIGIAGALVRIYTSGKAEAEMALAIMQKITAQGDELSRYFVYCRDHGVINAAKSPKIAKIPDEEINELKRVINRKSKQTVPKEEVKSIIVNEGEKTHESIGSQSSWISIITDDLEVFDEEEKKSGDLICLESPPSKSDANVIVDDLISL